MEENRLGTFVRERRVALNLTQEELAARIGGTASQAEVSRLERGSVALPRRSRLEALAGALEVTLGSLLINSGWLENDEGDLVDAGSPTQLPHDSSTNDAILAEMDHLRESLLTAVDRLGALEETIQSMSTPVQRPDVNIPTGIFDDRRNNGDSALSG